MMPIIFFGQKRQLSYKEASQVLISEMHRI